MQAEYLQGVADRRAVGRQLARFIYYLLVALVDRRTYGIGDSGVLGGDVAARRSCLMARLGCAHLSGGRGGRLPMRGVLAAVVSGDRSSSCMNTFLGPAARDRQELFPAVRSVGGCLGAGSPGVDVRSFTSHGSSR